MRDRHQGCTHGEQVGLGTLAQLALAQVQREAACHDNQRQKTAVMHTDTVANGDSGDGSRAQQGKVFDAWIRKQCHAQ